jgi:glyoxylase-like metal-dependent hydrolase (beta-lactamase superfamily II)
MTLKVGSESVTMRYLGAGHTNGDAIIHYEEANIVHLGDLIFNRRFPYIDKSAGADIKNWVMILEKVGKIFDKNTQYIFGHSGDNYDVIGTYDDVLAFKNYLEKLLDFGKSSIAAGKTLEQVKASTTSIPGAEEWKGEGISRSLDAVYAELGGR